MKFKLYISMAVTAVLSAACTHSDEEAVSANYPSDGAVHITTEVSQAVSRADATYTDYEGASLGMGIVYSDTQPDRYNRANVQWTKDASNQWAVATGEDAMLWKNATDNALKLYAYAPYQSGVTNATSIPFTVQSDQSSDILSSDLVGYAVSDFIPNTMLNPDGSVPVKLDHKCAKITVKLTYGSEFNGEDNFCVKSVRLKNVDTTVNYNATTATCVDNSLSGVGDVLMQNVTPKTSTAYTEYAAIVPAQTIKTGTSGINVNIARSLIDYGRTFSYTFSSDFVLAAGMNNTISLTVGRDGLFISDISVTPWDETTLTAQGTMKSVEYDAVNHSITVNEMGGLNTSSSEGGVNKPYSLIDKALNGTHILHVYGTINDSDLDTILNDTNVKVADLRHATSVNFTFVIMVYYNDEKYLIFTPEQVLSLSNSVNIESWRENRNYKDHILFVGRNLDYGIQYDKVSGYEGLNHTPMLGYVLSISDDAKSYTSVVKVTDAKTYADAVDYATNYKPSFSRLISSSDNFITTYTNALATDIYSNINSNVAVFKDYLAGNSYWFEGTDGTNGNFYLYDATNKTFSSSTDAATNAHPSLVVITHTFE